VADPNLRGFDRHVVELFLCGCTLEEAARAIYEDPNKRIKYRLDSLQHAERSALLASNRIAASAGA
jgi:hypothetical protein